MASAEEYRQQVSDLGLDRMETEASSLAEGKAAVGNVRRLQKELRHIKRNINLEMKTIRAEYKHKTSEVSAGMWGVLGGRKAVGQIRADKKRQLRAERDRKLDPYDQVKLTIDDLIVQLGGAKLQLQDFIQEAKAEDKAQKQVAKAKAAPEAADVAKAFCPQCGQAVDASDVFCRWCGHKLGSA